MRRVLSFLLAPFQRLWMRFVLMTPGRKRMLTTAVAIAGVSFLSFIVPHQAKATGWLDVEGTILGGVAALLQWILMFLIKMITTMVEVFMGFAAYNSFGSAAPVSIGWPVVRDICNMLFIVILLLSAFATIIGYEKSFHYKEVLPKLLLMVVLINFSKTIILLLIDFSQVITLTFVNAFAAAGPGNFINAFGLADYNKAVPPGPATAAGGPCAGLQPSDTYIQAIVSSLLGIVLASVSLVVMVVLVVYFIARIVILWVCLIMSPVALCVTAVPSKLQGKLGSLSGDYWNRLGAATTGGPIASFFMWLSLAVVQGSNNQTAASLGLAPKGVDDIQIFCVSIGSASKLSSFVVAIALMFMALDAAMKSGNALGAAFDKLLSATKTAAGGAAARALYAGGLGLRGIRRTGGYVAGKVDEKYDVSGRVGRAMLKTPVLRSVAGGAAVGLIGRQQILAKKKAEELQKGMEYLTPEERAQRGRALGGFVGGAAEALTNVPFIGGAARIAALSPAERAARVGMMIPKPEDTARMMKSRTAELAPQIAREMRNDPANASMSPVDLDIESKKRAGVRAKQEALEAQRKTLAEAREMIDWSESAGTSDQALRDLRDTADKLTDKNPLLADPLDQEAFVKRAKVDPDLQKGIGPDAKNSGALVHAFMRDALTTTGTGANKKVTGYDAAKRASLLNKIQDPTLRENIESVFDHIDGSPSGVAESQLQELAFAKEGSRVVMRRSGTKTGTGADSGGVVRSENQDRAKRRITDDLGTASHGVAATGGLTPLAAGAVDLAIQNGMLEDAMKQVEGDAPATSAVLSKISTDTTTNIKDFVTHNNQDAITKFVMPAFNQAKGLGQDQQVKAMRDLADQLVAMGTKYQSMNSANKENYLDIVRHMTELEKGIARKAPASRSTEEMHLATMVENLRTNPPTITVNTRAGGTKDEVPNTMKKALGID